MPETEREKTVSLRRTDGAVLVAGACYPEVEAVVVARGKVAGGGATRARSMRWYRRRCRILSKFCLRFYRLPDGDTDEYLQHEVPAQQLAPRAEEHGDAAAKGRETEGR